MLVCHVLGLVCHMLGVANSYFLGELQRKGSKKAKGVRERSLCGGGKSETRKESGGRGRTGKEVSRREKASKREAGYGRKNGEDEKVGMMEVEGKRVEGEG